MPKPRTIDEYLAGLSPEQRVLLEKLRRSIRRRLPRAEECISYSMPAFRIQGHVVAGFLATRKGYSYFPFSGSTLTTLADDIADHEHTKSALHFDADHPLHVVLLRKLLKVRIAETHKQPVEKASKRTTARSKTRAR